MLPAKLRWNIGDVFRRGVSLFPGAIKKLSLPGNMALVVH